MGKKLSQLPDAGALSGTERTQLLQAGTNVKVLLSVLKSYILGTIVADLEGYADNAVGSAIDTHSVDTDPHGDRSYADTAISQAIADLVAMAPETMDTLNEIAAALGDDPNFATTMLTALGYRVRFDAAQALTDPQKAQARDNIGAETAGAADTALTLRNVTKTGSYQLVAGDGDGRTCLRMNVAGAHNVTIPTDATETIPIDRPILVKWVGAGQPTIVATGVTTNGSLTFSAQGEAKMMVRVAANTWDIYGA